MIVAFFSLCSLGTSGVTQVHLDAQQQQAENGSLTSWGLVGAHNENRLRGGSPSLGPVEVTVISEREGSSLQKLDSCVPILDNCKASVLALEGSKRPTTKLQEHSCPHRLGGLEEDKCHLHSCLHDGIPSKESPCPGFPSTRISGDPRGHRKVGHIPFPLFAQPFALLCQHRLVLLASLCLRSAKPCLLKHLGEAHGGMGSLNTRGPPVNQ